MNKNILKIIIWLIFSIYNLLLFYCLFMGFNRSLLTDKKPEYNIIPLNTISYYIETMNIKNLKPVAINVIGNIVVFIPLGFILPILFKKMICFKNFTFIFITIILLIEITQILTKRGMADIDDVFLNYFGGSIGFLLLKIVQKRFFTTKNFT